MTNNINEMLGQLFDGMDAFISSKTVVGEPIYADGAIIIPLMEVSCGMGVGNFQKQKDAAKKPGGNKGDSSVGGLSTKMTPSAMLVIQNGHTKLIHVKNQDSLGKLLEMLPDLMDRFTGGSRVSKRAEAAAKEAAEQLSASER